MPRIRLRRAPFATECGTDVGRLLEKIDECEAQILLLEQRALMYEKARGSRIAPQIPPSYKASNEEDQWNLPHNEEETQLELDHANRFLSNIRLAANVTVAREIVDMHVIQLKKLYLSASHKKEYLIMVITNKRTMQIMDLDGRLLEEIQLTHETKSNKLIYVFEENNFVWTSVDDQQVVRNYYLNITAVDNATQLSDVSPAALNFTISLQMVSQFSVTESPGLHHNASTAGEEHGEPNSDPIQIQATELLMHRDQPTLLFGDQKGVIYIYALNGTALGKSAVSFDPIIQIERNYQNPLYITSRKVGLFNMYTQQISYPLCEKTPDEIYLLSKENQYSQHFYLVLQNLDIVMYELNSQQNVCKIKQKIGSGDRLIKSVLSSRVDLRIEIIQNFILLYGRMSSLIQVLNITQLKQDQNSFFDDISFSLAGFDKSDNRRFIESQDIAQEYFTKNLYLAQKYQPNQFAVINARLVGANQTLIQVYDAYMEQVSSISFNFLENLRFPMILVAVFVLFIIKYWNNKKPSYDLESDYEEKAKIDKLIREFTSKEQLGPADSNPDSNAESYQAGGSPAQEPLSQDD